MSEMFNPEEIGDYKVSDLLNLDVSYINRDTKRKRKGRIIKIAYGAAQVINRKSIVVWVEWGNIFKQP